MRHRVTRKHFGRDVKQRQALIKSLVRNLMLHGEVTTTKAKAKETKRWADKLIGRALKNDLNSRRVLHEFFGTRDVVNTLVDRVAPLFTDRVSGFTTLSVVGVRRGDNTEMVRLALVKKPEVTGSFKNTETKKAAKVVKKAEAPTPKVSKPVAKKTETKTAKAPAKKAAPKKATAKKEAPKKTVTKKKSEK